MAVVFAQLHHRRRVPGGARLRGPDPRPRRAGRARACGSRTAGSRPGSTASTTGGCTSTTSASRATTCSTATATSTRTAAYTDPDREQDQALLHHARHAGAGPDQRGRRGRQRDQGRADHRRALRRARGASSQAPDGEEIVVLDYLGHQRKLLPALAKTYALHFAQLELVAGLHDTTPDLDEPHGAATRPSTPTGASSRPAPPGSRRSPPGTRPPPSRPAARPAAAPATSPRTGCRG